MWIIVLFFGTQFPLCSGEGRTFMLPVTSIAGSGSETWVVITGQDETTVTLTSPNYTASLTVVIGADNSTSIPLTPQVMYENSDAVEHKGLEVVADHDVSVQVVTSISEGNTESYQALPKTVWSDEYYVSLYTIPTGRSSFVTIAAYDDDTSVDITIHTLAEQTSCSGITLDDGQILTKTLQSMDVWGVRCDKDLTGTYIKGNKPISVVAGAFDAKRFFMEMMMPVQLYGVNFVLPNITDVAIVFRVVASEDDTDVNTLNSTYTVEDKGSYVDIDRRVPETMCINTSKPVQVQMLLCSPDTNVTSFMMTIAPVERYLTAFRIPPSPANVSQRLMIYVTEKSNKLSLERKLQHATVVEESECCNYVSFAGSENIDNHLTLNLPFPVMILQYSVQIDGVEGHSVGYNMGSPTCPTEKGYQYDRPSKFCFKVGTVTATWMESVRLCESWFRHHLATLDSQSKSVALETFMKKNFASSSVWTGGQAIHGSEWRWPDNVTFSNTNWAQGQPDGSSSCLALYQPFDHKWDDLICNFSLIYACELRLEALPSVRLLETRCPYENQTCPSGQGYTYFPNGDLCIKPHAMAMNWTMANSLCRAHGDRLVKVDSEWKAAQITSFAERHLGTRVFLIGGSRQNTLAIANSRSEDFVWTDCSPLGISLWRVNEPSNSGGRENCVHLMDEKLNDIPCTYMYRFICEKTGETQLVSDAYDGSCFDQRSRSSSSYSVDLQPSSLSGGDGSISVSSDAGITPHPGASSVTVSTTSIPATVYGAFSSTSVDAVSLVSPDTASPTPSTMMVPATLIPNSSDSSVTLGTGSILVSPSDLATSSTTSAVAATASTTTIAAGLTILTTAPGLTPVLTAAGIAPLTTTPGLTPVSTAAGIAPLTTAPDLIPVSTAAGIAPLTTAPGLTPVSTAAAIAPLTTAPGLTPVSTAAGIAPLTTAPGLTLVSTAAGLAPLTTAPGLTLVSTAAGLAPLTTAPGLTLVSTAAGIAPLTTAPGLTPVSTAAGIAPLTTAPGLTLVSTAAGIAPLTTVPGLTLVSTAASIAPLTTAPGLTLVSTAAGLAPLTTAAGLTPSPAAPSGNTTTATADGFLLTTTSTSAALPTTSTSAALPPTSITSTSASPHVTPPGEWNISSWDKNWVLTFGPWKSDRTSGRWKRLVCRCACVPKRLKTLSPSGVEAVKETIESLLLLDNKNLTKKAAKYSSAKDGRISARGMGYSVICLISVPITLIVLADVFTCLCSVHKSRK